MKFAATTTGLNPESDGHVLVKVFADEAVSYTHLRAHETVLDLVCRLLLEKKKTSITNNTHSMNNTTNTNTPTPT